MINLQQPAEVWIAAIFVIIVVSVAIFWLVRNFEVVKTTLKLGPVETELGRKKKGADPAKSPAAVSAADLQDQRSQKMVNSEEGDQKMHGKGGIQQQDMKDTPRGKQNMD